MELHDQPAPLLSDYGADLPPPDVEDPVVDAFKKDIDRSLLRENLRLSPAQRAAMFRRFMSMVEEIRGAALPREMRARILARDDD